MSTEPATPQRPSYSADTSTTAPGTLEVEAGVAADNDDAVDSPLALKWGAAESVEMFLGFSPYLKAEAPGSGSQSGMGDVVLGTRIRPLEQEGNRPSGALQFAAKLPAADEAKGLGSGEVDVFGAAILTQSVSNTTWVAFYQVGILGNPGGSGSSTEHGLALALAHALADQWGAFVEVAGVFLPSADPDAIYSTVGLGYTVRSNVVLDAAVAVGLSQGATDLAFNLGFTANLGSLWE